MATLYPSIQSLQKFPYPGDGVVSSTLTDQHDTEGLIADVLDEQPPAHVPRLGLQNATTTLDSVNHLKFIQGAMMSLPSGFVGLDASRPWLVFWTVHSLDLLGVLLPQNIRDRAVSTILHFLHPTGGFCGGAANTHMPHLLPTYASVVSLAIVGNAGKGGGWERLVDARQDIYNFFMRCKRPDGGFVVGDNCEVDVRGTYCLLVVATLLDIITPELLHNVDKAIAAGQTFEGGFACSSFTFKDGNRVAMSEAHGGYTSCSVFSHFLLSSVQPPRRLESLPESFPVPIDVDSVVRWSAMMQGEAADGGGFRGRSNKLVDGCYSWWVGGTFPVLEELRRREAEVKTSPNGPTATKIVAVDDDGEDEWADEASMHALFNRGMCDSEVRLMAVALQEYTLLVAQSVTRGGLRDKPGKGPDLYHTCNNLSGLSVAQHRLTHTPEEVQKQREAFKADRGLPAVKPTTPGGGWKSEEERQAARREVWANVRAWVEDESDTLVVGGQMSQVNTTVPPFNMLEVRLQPFIDYFYCQ
ncbi:Farnesyltransferase [Cutaneotrichosporon oleaginosum]|uniref:Protein farnesyltransferase subunit beta n=1 Tax=Cutaneotrichosporon oleaginosum TaxID=879819 RepID=A0A0J0XJ39_9TREE|nr:Farnesyltransferase [Cutaneotrichosporon oleaginosum]KLT41078.1 Farnesyltransferase [Cutaneotrichosporon oleaginosum]TXT05787.1 hypothetical protein COLE_07107 [Cutaneotrichosporon oleaginosum]